MSEAAISGNGSTEMVKFERSALTAFEPSGFRELMEASKYLFASKFLPRSITSPEAVATIIIAGRELGLTMLQALRVVHFFDGKLVLAADLMVALAKRKPQVCRYFRLVESTDERAVYETQREGDPEPTRMTWTMDQAKAAGLTGKDNWRKFGAAMLRARCAAALCRVVYPDLFMGIYDPDELDAPQAPREMPRAVVRSIADAEVVSTPPVEEKTIEEQANEWMMAFVNAKSTAEVASLRKAFQALPSYEALKWQVSPLYEEAKARVSGKPLRKEPKPVETPPVVEREIGEEG